MSTLLYNSYLYRKVLTKRKGRVKNTTNFVFVVCTRPPYPAIAFRMYSVSGAHTFPVPPKYGPLGPLEFPYTSHTSQIRPLRPLTPP